jgi:uncharacterized protein (TIGR02145 family)
MKKLITLFVFLILFCSMPVLALDAPTLTVTTSGVNVTLSWTSVSGATGYTLFYAPYPDASYIGQIDMGTQTSLFSDASGVAFYVAIQSYNASGSSGYSNIEYFDLSSDIWYQDSDGDGYGSSSSSLSTSTQPYGYVSNKTDCNDNDASIHPSATEIAGDGIDQDCNGSDLAVSKTYYLDSDGDGYGDSSSSTDSTSQPTGYVSDNTDCDDIDATIYPGATEIAGDAIDQDCNGSDLAASKPTCGAYVAPGVWKEFDCYNLAAIAKTTNGDPFTPSWRLIGGYWQWGRKGPDSSQWYDTNTANFAHGPTGPDLGDANVGTISSWDDNYAPNGSWSDTSKTANDPCPTGYRVPTKSQWDGVIKNNTHSFVGTWDEDATNYSSAQCFGNDLLLPATGDRHSDSGLLYGRGKLGYYWSTTQSTLTKIPTTWGLIFVMGSGGTTGIDLNHKHGCSVRCVAE